MTESSISSFSTVHHKLIAFLVTSLFLSCISTATGQTSITIDATQLRGIGGVTTLDRTRFFNHTETISPPGTTNLGNLANELGAASGLNSSTGRISTEFDQFIAQNLGEDPTRPGFIDPTQLREKLQGDYRNFVTQGSRWKSLRENPNSFVVNSGRSASFWPAFMRTSGGSTSDHFPNKDAYAEFINIYLDEVVYGANAFMPVDKSRFHIELLNEPDLHLDSSFTAQAMAEYHRDVAQAIKAQHPTASIGGPSLAITAFAENNFQRWDDVVKPFIDTAGADLDFYSVHPYERYSVQQNGDFARDIEQSPGRVTAMIDLIQNHHQNIHGDQRQISFSEYGSFNRLATNPDGTPNIGNYARDEQQWDLARDVRDKLFVFLNRPDTVLNATPFVAPRDFRQDTPTNPLADNVFWEQDASGDWQETIVGNMFRLYAPVQGEYVGISGDNKNIQSVAFRDGDTVYLLLNNLLASDQQLDLQVLAGGLGTVNSASIDRVFRDNGVNTFINDSDITSNFQNLTLNGEEGAVVTFTLDSADDILFQTNEQTFYGDQVVSELDLPTGRSPIIGIDADLSEAINAVLRLNYNRPSDMPEAFDILVNGNLLTIQSGGLGIDDGDFEWFSREIDIPLEFLINGSNEIQVDFEGNGGFLSTAALVVTSSIVAVPEPSSLACLLGLGLAGVMQRRRRS
jgi:agarase